MINETKPEFSRAWKTTIIVSLVLALLGGSIGALSFGSSGEQAVQRSTSNTPVHFDQGGKSLVVGSGGTLSIESGGTLDLAGTFSGGIYTTTISDLLNANGGIAVDTSAFEVADTSGNTMIDGTLLVTGTSTLGGGTTVGGGYGSTGCTFSAAGVLQCNGAATIDGATTSTGLLTANAGIAVDSTAFTVADTSGNVSTAGTLNVTGASTLQGGIVINGRAYTETAPITITDVLTNVRLLVYQVP